MALQFRNLNISPDTPVAQWPTEAVQTELGSRPRPPSAAKSPRKSVRLLPIPV